MKDRPVLADHELPDIRPGDIVRRKTGRLSFRVEHVERGKNYSCAVIVPTERFTAKGGRRGKEYASTSKLILLERPLGSTPQDVIPWIDLALNAYAGELHEQYEIEQRERIRLNTRLERLSSAAIDVQWREEEPGEEPPKVARVRQWRNGEMVSTRLCLYENVNPQTLLGAVKAIEDWLDAVAAGDATDAEWLTSPRGATWRGMTWTKRTHERS